MNRSQVDLSMTCENCEITFDLEIRVPKLLPCCKRTICMKCIRKIPLNPDRKCPGCRRGIGASLDFDSNETIMDKIQGSKFEKCPIHRKEVTHFCEDHRTKICSDCVYKTDCANHERYELEQLEEDGKVGREMYEKKLDDLEDQYVGLQGKLAGNRKRMEERLSRHFEEQQYQLERNKMEALYYFNQACTEEKTEFERLFGENSSVRNELRSIISDHVNICKIPDPIRAIENKYIELNAKVNSLMQDKDNILSFDKQLANISESLSKKLSKQATDNENNRKDFMKHIVQEMKTKGLPEFEGTKDHLFVRKPELKFTSNLDFKLTEGILSITQRDKIKEEFSFSKQQLRQIVEIKFAFESLNIENEDWEAIFKLISKVLANRDNSLRLYLRSEKNGHSTMQVSKLFSTFFNYPTRITSLKISLYLDRDAMLLLNLVLPQLSSLESLALTFRKDVFPMECFDNFIENLRILAGRLESLYLHFARNQIDISKLQEIFIEMPVLKKFDLNVSQIPSINDKFLTPLKRKAHQLMPQLQEILLNVSHTSVTKESLNVVEYNFKEIRKTINSYGLLNGGEM